MLKVVLFIIVCSLVARLAQAQRRNIVVEEQALKLTVLWQQTNDLLSQIQAVAPDNTFVQEIEAVRERLDGVVNRAVGGDDNGRTPEEEARINELEMWGAGGRPRGPWL